MSRPRAATFEQQRDAILATAARLFAERGYPEASIADIAAACGVSKGLLYHYSRDKEQWLFDIADRYVGSLVELCATVEAECAAEAAAGHPPDAAARLRRLIERFMAAYEHAGAHHRVLVQDVKYLRAPHRRRIQARQRAVVERFAHAVAAAAPQLAGSPLLMPVTMTLFGMINWTFTWMRGDGPVTHAQLAPAIASLFLDGVRAVRSAPELASSAAAHAAASRSTSRPRRRAAEALPHD